MTTITRCQLASDLFLEYTWFYKLCSEGAIRYEISVPALFGCSHGSIHFFVTNLATPVSEFLNFVKKELHLAGNNWGLLLRNEGIWLSEIEVIGRYSFQSLVTISEKFQKDFYHFLFSVIF